MLGRDTASLDTGPPRGRLHPSVQRCLPCEGTLFAGDTQMKKTIDSLLVDLATQEAACQHMGCEQLTEEQKFAIAYFAGVPLKSRYAEGKIFLVTEPCSIIIVDGKWQVFYRKTK